jgi:leader peptidase (prepilin peptidase)/N-methyltransferase
LDLFIATALFLAGLAFGSFLNVCITRIPRDESVVAPRSHCRACNSPIAWRDNIPLLSWIVLRGRCRSCGAHIPRRYLAVEFLTALAFLACGAQFGLTASALRACSFCFLIIGLIFMDAETGLLPAEFTYAGIPLGLLFAWFAPLDTTGTRFLLWLVNRPGTLSPAALSMLDALIAALVGAGFYYLAWAGYYLVRKRDGLGFGDIALMAMVGAFLGLKLTVLVIAFAPLTALLFAVFWMFPRRDHAAASGENSLLQQSIPFGVFIGISALIALFFGQPIWRWYLGLFS